LAVCLAMATTSPAQSKTEIGETNLLRPITRLDFALGKMEQKIERLGPQYRAVAILAFDKLFVSVRIGVDGPLAEPADKVCAAVFQLMQAKLSSFDEFFERRALPPEPWDGLAELERRYLDDQNTSLYLAKLQREAGLETSFWRSPEMGASGKFVIYKEGYSCKGLLKEMVASDIQFKRWP
jgi:hypothetical protein